MKFVSVLTIISSLTSSYAFAAPSNIELKYFGARGAAETTRIILALANKEYKDTRFEITPGTMNAPEFIAAKEAGELDMNLGRAPVLFVDGKPLGQSKAIERYLAKQLGLMGESDFEAAQIDCIAEHCRDVKDAQMRKGFSAFNREKSEEEKAKARKEWFDVDMPLMLSKIEKAVKMTSSKNGYAVGDRNSYADVAIFSLLMDCTMQSDQDETLKAAEGCQLLMDIANRIASDDNVSKWIQERPKSMF
jgi:Glutathione S-transferase